MEALASLLVISLMGSVLLPLYLWVFQQKQALTDEYQILMQLEEKRYSYYLERNDDAWKDSGIDNLMEFCVESEVRENEENCI